MSNSTSVKKAEEGKARTLNTPRRQDLWDAVGHTLAVGFVTVCGLRVCVLLRVSERTQCLSFLQHELHAGPKLHGAKLNMSEDWRDATQSQTEAYKTLLQAYAFMYT